MLLLVAFCLLPGALASAPSPAEVFLQRIKTSPKYAPRIPATLVFSFDGPSENLVMDEDLLRLFHHLSGRYSDAEIIAQGRKAARFFRAQYGVDFTYAEDDVLLGRKNATTSDGTATFLSGVVSPETYYRLISYTAYGKAIQFNNYVADGGWYVLFNKPFMAYGALRSLIPANSIGYYGNYAMNLEESVNDNIGLPPPLGPKLVIHFQSSTVLYPPDPISGAILINSDIRHPLLGVGMATGVAFPDVDDVKEIDSKTVYNGKNVLTFPQAVLYSATLLSSN